MACPGCPGATDGSQRLAPLPLASGGGPSLMYETLAGWYVPVVGAGGAFAFGKFQAGSRGVNLPAKSVCASPASGWLLPLEWSDPPLTLRPCCGN